MGHMQCISKSREADIQTLQAKGKQRVLGIRLRPWTESAGTPTKTKHMILSDAASEKPAVPVRFKDLGQDVTLGDSTEDTARVKRAMVHLRESGWYWGSLTAAQAKQVLSEALEGTFLLRDSSNPSYLLTLSVKTSLGPTHLRIEHSAGAFGFDSLAVARPRLRRFSGAVELVLHYAIASQGSIPAQGKLRSDEETADGSLQLRLTRPLCKSAPSLQHLCRIAVNRLSCRPQDLPLPGRLKAYLLEYPFLL